MFNKPTTLKERSEWLKMRRLSIGASDYPAIIGKSPWRTRLDLWKEKTSTKEPDPTQTTPQILGNLNESYARDWYEEQRGMKFEPKWFRHPDINYLTASMDGWNQDTGVKLGIEIKCPGKADHATAAEGKIPEKYRPQIVAQYIVTGADKIDYVSFKSGGPNYIVEAPKPTPEELQEFYRECGGFWSLVQARTPPALTDRDWLTVTDKDAMSWAGKYKALLEQEAWVNKELDKAREVLMKYVSHNRVKIGTLTIQKQGESHFFRDKIEHADKVQEPASANQNNVSGRALEVQDNWSIV